MGSDGLQTSSDEVMKSGCIQNVLLKSREFADGLDMEFEKNGGMQEDSRISGQNN